MKCKTLCSCSNRLRNAKKSKIVNATKKLVFFSRLHDNIFNQFNSNMALYLTKLWSNYAYFNDCFPSLIRCHWHTAVKWKRWPTKLCPPSTCGWRHSRIFQQTTSSTSLASILCTSLLQQFDSNSPTPLYNHHRVNVTQPLPMSYPTTIYCFSRPSYRRHLVLSTAALVVSVNIIR